VVLLLSFLGAAASKGCHADAGTSHAGGHNRRPDPAPAANAWAAVQQRGRLIVGTSADYPPFAFSTEAFELTAST
jgi:ABC-type amino acid transport substrate-binding protein